MVVNTETMISCEERDLIITLCFALLQCRTCQITIFLKPCLFCGGFPEHIRGFISFVCDNHTHSSILCYFVCCLSSPYDILKTKHMFRPFLLENPPLVGTRVSIEMALLLVLFFVLSRSIVPTEVFFCV